MNLLGIDQHAHAGKAAQTIQPCGIDVYMDCVHAWSADRLTTGQIKDVRANCRGPMYEQAYRKRWSGDRYQHYLCLEQPTDAAFEYLTNIPDVMINYGEFALDHNFNDQDERDAAISFFNQHSIKRWHRDSQGIRYVKGVTRYTADRAASSNLVSYADKPSRITGELYCVHIEFRISGQRNLEKIGINTPKDYIGFDHYRFWKERLLMRTIDMDRFGKLYNRRILHKGPRTGPWIQKISDRTRYNYDQRTAGIVLNISDLKIGKDGEPNYVRRYGSVQAI